MIISDREKIILEFIRRLKSKLHPIPIIRGYEDAVIEKYPSITVIELTSKSGKNIGTDSYEKTLPLQIQFYGKVTDHDKKMPVANIVIENIRSAIELDPYFAIDADETNTDKYLCQSYKEIEVTPGILPSGVIVVFILYEFEYYEQHKAFVIEETDRTLDSIMNYIEAPEEPQITQDFIVNEGG